jgi:hypothetical protein
MQAAALLVFCVLSGKQLIPQEPVLLREQLQAALTGGVCQAISVFGIIASLSHLPVPVTIINWNRFLLRFLLTSCLAKCYSSLGISAWCSC